MTTNILDTIIIDPEWPPKVLAEIHARHQLRTLVYAVVYAAMEQVHMGKSCWYEELVTLVGEAHQARKLERERDQLREAIAALKMVIKEADAALRAWPKAGSGVGTNHTLQSQAFRTGQSALAKLKPFLPP